MTGKLVLTTSRLAVALLALSSFVTVDALPAASLPALDIELAIEGWDAHGAPLQPTLRRVTLPPAGPLKLELGQKVTALRVLPPAGAARSYRVQMRYETTLVVEGEGPTLPLTNWKHHVSDWTDLMPAAGTSFLTPPLFEVEELPFPQVSMDDVLHAVDEHGGGGWLNLARSATGPTSYPLDVALSRIWLRLLEGDDGTQRELAIVEVVVPTGC